jgi:RNA polymerase sigma factor for flagellar operon FliA
METTMVNESVDELDEHIVIDSSQDDVDDGDILLWQEYKETNNPDLRERIIIKYTSFVKYIAGRVAMGLPPNVVGDDLVGYGVFGLIDAIEKFQPERNIKFKTYAQTRIRGAILDKLREQDWTPRSVRTRARKLEKAYMELENTLGRSATDEEVSAHLGISLQELYKLYNDTRSAFMISLDEIIYGEDEKATRGDFVSDDQTNPQKVAERKELKRLLVEAIKELSERERLVLTLYYYEEMTLKEIGSILDVSDSRVSQLHTKAILKLRGKLKKLYEE